MNQKNRRASKTADRDQIVSFLNTELRIGEIKDSSCNGLQVQGCAKVRKAALVVDACIEAYRKAVAEDCQLVIAHHGIIWDGIKSISKLTYTHVKYLLDNDLNLYAAHLPLDLHPTLGNNAGLARLIGLKRIKPFGLYHGIMIGFQGELTSPTTPSGLAEQLASTLGGDCTVLPFGKKSIRTVAIVSGGAAGELNEAAEKRIDCYITGEPIHSNHHLALETGTNVIYCGHYFSEKPGVQAIGKLLQSQFGIETVFLDIPTFV